MKFDPASSHTLRPLCREQVGNHQLGAFQGLLLNDVILVDLGSGQPTEQSAWSFLRSGCKLGLSSGKTLWSGASEADAWMSNSVMRLCLYPSDREERLELDLLLGDRAVAIDEEPEFAFLNGYCLLRLGYDTRVVTSHGDLNELQKFDLHPNVVITDLAFEPVDSKGEGEDETSDGELQEERYYRAAQERDKKLTGCKERPNYVFASGSARDFLKSETWAKRCNSGANFCNRAVAVPKPHPGIHRMLVAISMLDREAEKKGSYSDRDVRARRKLWLRRFVLDRKTAGQACDAGSAAGRENPEAEATRFVNWTEALFLEPSVFARRAKKAIRGARVWLLGTGDNNQLSTNDTTKDATPPDMSAKIDRSDARRGQGAIGFRNRLADLQARVAKKWGATKTHAAPGRLGYLASKLIEKGQRQLADCRTSIDFLKVAILALRARYLLCGQTPTLNLQAIALQHRAEAKAECMFLGVEDSADIEMRIEEIKCEVAEICTKYGDEKGMRISYHSSLIEILTDLHKVYEEHGRFEEKLACANAIRIEKTRILWVNPGWKVLYLWIRSYFVHLVASPKLFGVMLAISFAFAFLLFGLNDHTVRIFYLDNPPSINFDFASRLFQFVLFSKTDGFDKEPLFLEGWPLFVGRVLLPAFWWIHLGAFLALLTSRVTRN